MGIKEAISEAERFILLNQKPQARAILREIVHREPDCEEAWLLSAQVFDKPEHISYCYKQALRINPRSETARQELNRFQDAETALETNTPPMRKRTPSHANSVTPKVNSMTGTRKVEIYKAKGWMIIFPILGFLILMF